MRSVHAVLWAVAGVAFVGAAVPLYLIVRPAGRTTWGLVEVVGVTLFFAGTLPLAGLLLPHGAATSLPPFWLVSFVHAEPGPALTQAGTASFEL